MKGLSDELEVGKQIQITRELQPEEYLASQILDKIDDDRLVIAGPIKKSNLILIHTGDLIDIYITSKNIGIYSFTAKVLSREYSPVYTIMIERISEVKRTQKRKYFRLPLEIEVEKEHGVVKNYKFKSHKEKCKAKDLSGGGMKIFCNHRPNINDEVFCNFKINDLPIKTKAIVRRVEKLDAFNYKYAIGVSFEDIDESDKDEIIKYLFEQQRILRNKGLI